MTATLNPQRLKEVEALPLLAGSHSDEEYGKKMCVMEAVAYVAGEPRTDHPKCACPVVANLLRRWNDRLGTGDTANAERDRLLKPLVARLVGSRSTPEVEAARRTILRDWTRSAPLADWLEAAGLQEHADAVRATPENIDVICAARTAAWEKRATAFEPLRKKVREAVKAELEKQGKAVAVAAVADAAAVAVADAADADAAAAAVADAVAADADAAADAAAAAAVAADAAAAAVAVAAVAVADAADAVADAADAVGLSYGDAYWKIRHAVYDAVYEKFKAAVDADERLSTLRAKHERGLLETIDAMLAVTPESLAA